MALIRKIAALILAALMILMLLPVPENTALAETDGMVRVKLTRLGTPSNMSFTAGCDYYVNGYLNARISSGSKVTLNVSGNSIILSCNGYTLDMGDDFTIKRKSTGAAGVRFTSPALSNLFCGDFRFMLSSGGITTILTIYVEDYLKGVIAYEMSNSYPIEALKAQAVAARNYVLRAKMNRTSKTYDVTDTTSDQVFKGYNSGYDNVRRAVEATEGMVLGYNGKLAACYYGASNGGQTESTANVWGSNLPYSVVRDDKYDLESASKCNSVTLKKDQSSVTTNANLKAALVAGMKDQLEKYGLSTAVDDVHIEEIVSITPHTPKYAEPSRLYTKLGFEVKASSVNAAGERVAGNVTVDIDTYGAFESWFKLSLNSSANETVTVEETETAFKISFRRWGHGIGLSQHGARVMARDYGMGYRDILEFYYPGTQMHTLSLADNTGTGLKNGGTGTTAEPTAAPTIEPTIEPTAEPTVEPTAAPEEKPAMQAAVKLSGSSSRLNLREKATTGSKVLAKLKNGDVVDVYALDGDWVAIGANGLRGYVMKKYLVRIEDGATPAPDATAAPEATPEPESGAFVYARVKLAGASSKLNLRAQPSTSAKVLAQLKNGEIVKVTSLSGDWARSEKGDGTVGYAHRDYLVKANVTAAPEATPAPEATMKPESAPDVTPEPTPAPTVKSVKAEATDYTFVYSKADDGARPVAGMDIGDIVTVTAVENGWAKVVFGRHTGYVPTDCLKLVE